MCLSNGRAGGLSAVANSVTINNLLVRDRPDLAAALYEPFPFDFRGEQAEGGKAFYELPVFTAWTARMFVRCITPYFCEAQVRAEAPRPTHLTRPALQAVEGTN